MMYQFIPSSFGGDRTSGNRRLDRRFVDRQAGEIFRRLRSATSSAGYWNGSCSDMDTRLISRMYQTAS